MALNTRASIGADGSFSTLIDEQFLSKRKFGVFVTQTETFTQAIHNGRYLGCVSMVQSIKLNLQFVLCDIQFQLSYLDIYI